MYITYDSETMITTGCSSTEPVSESFIYIENLDEKFFNAFDCYRVTDGNIVFDENVFNNRVKEANSYLTPEQLLGQENSDLQIELIKIKLFLNIPEVFSKNEYTASYWNERFNKKYANKKQIEELRTLGIIS